MKSESDDERRMKYVAVGFLAGVALLAFALGAVGIIRLVAVRLW